MARVAFSSMIYEIVGKLGGCVFQYSYGGYQVHVKTSPRNPQTQYQQLRRGDFGFLAASWRNLSSIQRQTFIDAAITEPAAFNLFVASNVNLILIEEPTITDYVPTTTPISMPVEVVTLEPGAFNIAASSGTTVVPAGTSLLVYSTNLKGPTKIFTNPSQYSPIAVFPAGTNIAAATSIKTQFNSRFGQITANKRLCIKSVLIDITNGSRGAESFNCTTSDEMPTGLYYYATLNQAGSGAPAAAVAGVSTLTGIVWSRVAPGNYLGILVGAFPANRTFFACPVICPIPFGNVSVTRVSDDTLAMYTLDTSGAPVDGLLNDFTLQVTVTNS